jgi:hypothetical protein
MNCSKCNSNYFPLHEGFSATAAAFVEVFKRVLLAVIFLFLVQVQLAQHPFDGVTIEKLNEIQNDVSSSGVENTESGLFSTPLELTKTMLFYYGWLYL